MFVMTCMLHSTQGTLVTSAFYVDLITGDQS